MRAGFKTHLAIYVGVILLLTVVNLTASRENLWVQWPMIGWGVGLFFYGLNAYVLKGFTGITEEMIRKEMKNSGSLETE